MSRRAGGAKVIRAALALAVLAGLAAAAAIGTERGRQVLRAAKSAVEWRLAARGTRREEVFVEVEGARLATDIYLPRSARGPLPTILLRLPYGKRSFAEVRWWLALFGRDHAVAVQDMRGRGRSTGRFAAWPSEGADGAATLDWIAARDWSNGRVGTAGCSALGEAQIALAALRHPSHAAMIALGAGGGVGELDGRRAPFGIWEGGIPALATGAGWFASEGGSGPSGARPDLSHLPLRDVVSAVRGTRTGWEEMLDGFADPGFAARMGYADEGSRFAAPALVVDGWYDPNVAASLSLTRAMRAQGLDAAALVLPATHCDMTGGFRAGGIGDVPVAGEAPDLGALFRAFMARHLGDAAGAPRPPFRVWVMGEDRWLDSEVWPPSDETLVLHLDGEALAREPGAAPPRSFVSDPSDPVRSIGGAICCTDAVRSGPLDQTPIEGRADLLHWTAEPGALGIAGAPEVALTLSVDAPDADIVARLTELRADGASVTVTEGALRLRYRDGISPGAARAAELPEGPFEARVRLAPIAHRLAEGSRLRLHVAASSFPRLARNMQGGGDPHRETEPRPARITVHSGAVTLPLLP